MASSSSQSNQKSSSDPPAPDPPLTRQEQEQATQDRTLAEFLLILDEYEPLVFCFILEKSALIPF
jgi:hypothetical protein